MSIKEWNAKVEEFYARENAKKIEEFYARELERYRTMWEAGIWPALAEAVHYCSTVDLPLPEWAALAVLNIIQDHYHVAVSSKAKGAHASPKGQVTMAYAHFLRWKAVRVALRAQFLSELPNKRGRPGGPTKIAVLSYAATWLREQKKDKLARLGDAGVRELERSYRRVERSRARDEAQYSFDDLLTL